MIRKVYEVNPLLKEIYEEINKVNDSFCKRLKQIDNIEDAALNAVVKLDCFA
jgi:hypothetical protein